ncbi:hypothetical protein NHX12_026193 [Muraenolepis orangiensis]|uniref:BHLH domain-containing protein n=1 Tax=Muraenolepis orangiensis TaxID=630683 RepID=A0A9Q0EGY2_9TELE|nr:hypothetical protein NHX12_026193 [Muraenolepis orangiensis]
MEQTPLESLMSISVVHQTGALDPVHQKPSRSGRLRQPRSWVSSESRCGPGGPAGSGVVTRGLRSHHSPENAARERSRLDVLLLATNYITQLSDTLQRGGASQPGLPRPPGGGLHPVKKWPMRSLLYCGNVGELLSANQKKAQTQEVTRPPIPKFENSRE